MGESWFDRKLKECLNDEHFSDDWSEESVEESVRRQREPYDYFAAACIFLIAACLAAITILVFF